MAMLWLCCDYAVSTHCEWGKRPFDSWCRKVRGYTRASWKPSRQGKWGKLELQRDFSSTQNPLTLSIGGWRREVLGVEVLGTDPKGLIKVNFINQTKLTQQSLNDNGTALITDNRQSNGKVVVVDYTRLKPQDVIERATGLSDSNLWLDWVAQKGGPAVS